jgi:hypothetical protein
VTRVLFAVDARFDHELFDHEDRKAIQNWLIAQGASPDMCAAIRVLADGDGTIELHYYDQPLVFTHDQYEAKTHLEYLPLTRPLLPLMKEKRP